MLWFMPRSTARRVLSTWANVIEPCENSPHAWCCNLSVTRLDGPGGGADADRVSYSNWMRHYWARAAHLVPDYNSMRGWGLLGANPLKGRWRNCTMHVGCKLPGWR